MCAGDAGSVRDKGVWWEQWTNGGPRCVMGIQRELRGGAEGWALSELLCLWGLWVIRKTQRSSRPPPCAATKAARRSLPSLSHLLCWARLLSLLLSLLALSQLS